MREIGCVESLSSFMHDTVECGCIGESAQVDTSYCLYSGGV